ncbi:MAG TPA: hypothetical protein VL282_09140 [Tepidisphaeraceae bacterium]|jgi:hypothetical protein|nr:hypothetical protein [Tepidisphaeraceae bacterium]
MTEPSSQLEYAQRPSLVRRRWKLIIFATILVTSLLGALFWRDTIRIYSRQAHDLYVQRRALNYTIDPDRVVYEEDEPRGAALAKKSDYHDYVRSDGRHVTMWDPKVWDSIASSKFVGLVPSRKQALLFLHERTTPTGECLLLGVHASVEPPNKYHRTESLMFHLEEIIPGDWEHMVRPRNGLNTPVVGLDFSERDKPLRLFGGQVDPNDRAHFTIRYQLGDEEGIIDGYEGDRTVDAQGVPKPGLRLE